MLVWVEREEPNNVVGRERAADFGPRDSHKRRGGRRRGYCSIKGRASTVVERFELKLTMRANIQKLCNDFAKATRGGNSQG